MPIYKQDKQKDGRYQYRVFVSFTDAQGNHKKVSRTVYGAAEAKQVEMQLQREVGERKAPCSMTVQQLFGEFITVKSHELRRSSLEKSERILKHDVLPLVGDRRIDKLTTKLLQDWKTQIAERDLKVTTKNNIYREFRCLLNYAVKMEYIPKNPLLALGGFKDAYDFATPQETLHYYTVEQFRRFIAVAEQRATTLTDCGFYVFFCIAFYTGMRKGEINALKWSDVEGNVIHVRRSIAQKVKGCYEETPPKNRSSYRDLQMPAQLMKILEAHRERQKQCRGFSDDFRVCGGTATSRS